MAKPTIQDLTDMVVASGVKPDKMIEVDGKRMSKAEFLARRAIDRGLTTEDIEWNQKLSRPPHWKETVHPEAETERRKNYREA